MRTGHLVFGAFMMAMPLASAHAVIPAPCPAIPGFYDWGREAWGAEPIWLGRHPTPELPHDVTVKLLLSPIETVELAQPLGKPAQSNDHGGIIAFRAMTSGSYRVALGGNAALDIVRHGKAVAPIAYAKGTPCSRLVEMIDFNLKRGVYTIQLSAVAEPTIRMAIRKLP